MAATLTGERRKQSACALRRDGSPVRYVQPCLKQSLSVWLAVTTLDVRGRRWLFGCLRREVGGLAGWCYHSMHDLSLVTADGSCDSPGLGLSWQDEHFAFHCNYFVLQGPFDRDDCPCKHSINPYSNKESRILFSTWNLDHM